MVRLSVNGISHELPEGLTILAALEQLGLSVPHLCHDDRLTPAAVCRLCLVELDGELRPIPSCATEIRDGMALRTHSSALEAAREGAVRALAETFPAGHATRFADKPFQKLMKTYGVEPRFSAPASGNCLGDGGHPYLHVDMSACIECYRCVRICAQVQGQFSWAVWGRGEHTQVVPSSGTTLLESGCTSCGACADTCPTGAIEDRTAVAVGALSSWTRTVCPYCGVGCELLVGTHDGRVAAVRPANGAANRGHVCVKGRYAFEYNHVADRQTSPMIREGGTWRRTSWDEAIAHVARELVRLVDAPGPGSVGVLGSARATNEENYLAQKFARLVLKTNNVDCCARVCHAPSAAALKAMLETGAATNSFGDIERARTLLIAGSNATACHPVLGARIKQAALAGAKLIVIDPRRIELAQYATVFLQPRAGTDIVLLSAMANVILTEELADADFLRARVDGLAAHRAAVAQWTPERAAEVCRVEARLIREAARLYATVKPSMSVHGLGMTEHVQGTERVMCLINLALLTGNLGKPGTGINPLRGQNNVQGSAHMGCEPNNLTGMVPLEKGRALVEAAWGAELPRAKGLDLLEMLDEARAGRFKGLWAIGYDVLFTTPFAARTREALSKLRLVVVQDLFLNETAREFGTVFLPACSNFEKDGTFMNGERRVQRVRAALPPLGESRTDGDIICSVARAMGARGFDFQSPKDVWNEVRKVWQAGAGISYERLEAGGLQWPCPSDEHPGTSVLHGESFPIGPKAALRPVAYTPTRETVTPELPFLLTTGRTLYHFNAGTMTRRTRNLELWPTDVLCVAPSDARELGLKDGEKVAVASRHGRTRLSVKVDASVQAGELFTTFHDPAVFINEVTSDVRDGVTHTPEYKVTAVRLEPI